MNAPKSAIIPPDWQRWSNAKPTVIRSLTGGLTNRNYLVVADRQHLVLRKNSAISVALDLNRSAETDALCHADKAGLCAPVIYSDPGHQYLVTRYIEGQQWSCAGQSELGRLAQLLRRIHALPAIEARLDIETKVANYWRSIDEAADFYRELCLLDRNIRPHIASAHSMSDGACLCHNDLLPANLVAAVDGNLYAIDWEYAATGDPFYELAVIVEEYGLERRQRDWLLSNYLNRVVEEAERQRLEHWQLIYGYLSTLWYAVQWCTGAMADASIQDDIKRKIRNLSALSSSVCR